MNKRIAITGIGVVSPLGIGLEKFWESLASGRSGIDYISSSFIGAEIKDFKAGDFVPRKSIKVMARDIQIACAAAKLAIDDSSLDRTSIPPTRIGVSIGAGLINVDINEMGVVAGHSIDATGAFDIKKFGGDGIRELMPLWLLKQLPNMPSSHVSIINNAQGPSNSITTGCSSSLLSIGEAMGLIKKDRADVMLSGGTDSKINPLSILRLYLLKILAHGWERPVEASRPFDKKRNGLVAGEGAGVVVLEELSKATARGSKVYGELIGFGSNFSNKARAMRDAIKNAGISEGDIDLISANGISTQKHDTEEREAIQELFGEKAKIPPIIAPKATMGYPGAASGVMGLIAAILSMRHGVIPSNPNYTERDDGDCLDHVKGASRKKEINCAMVNAFGMEGHNGVIIVRRSRVKD